MKTRLSADITHFLLEEIIKLRPDAELYLFGSRVDLEAKGGDIDILVLSRESLSLTDKMKLNNLFIRRFGDRKIDIVSFGKEDENAFKTVALEKSVRLL